MTEVVELAEKDAKTTLANVFKDIVENMSILNMDMKTGILKLHMK
jgi:hypothetical protein